MAKKLTLPFAALAVVLALAVPATAAAEDVLLPVGTTIRIFTTTTSIKSSTLGTISCKQMTWEGVLNENGGKLLIKEMPGSANECVNGTNTVVMNSMEIKPTKIEEAEAKEEKGTVHWRFNMTIGAATKCTFEGNGTFTYTKGTDKSAFKESAL
ncbi:MAG TPA: hypothetical protein VGI17_06620, partial [Solirubrobacterales bacterium]